MQNPNKIQKFSHETNFLVTNKRNYHNTLIQIYQIWKKKKWTKIRDTIIFILTKKAKIKKKKIIKDWSREWKSTRILIFFYNNFSLFFFFSSFKIFSLFLGLRERERERDRSDRRLCNHSCTCGNQCTSARHKRARRTGTKIQSTLPSSCNQSTGSPLSSPPIQIWNWTPQI